MVIMKPSDKAKLLTRLADHLDCYFNRYHLTLIEAEFVATVWLAYKVADKGEHFARWLEMAVSDELISPYGSLKEEETAASVIAIPQGCQRVWDEYWRKKR